MENITTHLKTILKWSPIRLTIKDGGIFLDGWKTGQPDKQAAAFVYYPGETGRVYGAYYNGRQIFHFGVNASQIHPAIQVWTKRFLPPSAVISHTKERSAGDPRSFRRAPVLPKRPYRSDKDQLRQVAASIWDPSIVNYWNMNTAVGNILATVTVEILKCSEQYAKVPLLNNLLNPVLKPRWEDRWKLVAQYFKQIIFENYKISQQEKRYQTCIYATAVNWRSPIEMASAGI
ncbi:hypothetical protein [Xylella fastidiosa]|uniref:Uncharacterized protein n=1 Tax=Xylella fastidiosa subsp. sandyi Ann-1 TaxID=155920 RepID=A0A060H6X7_XYLFS|nr:hypothetical protein [Xylella fastidiosa]AIC11060.1 hypothetical protein D934_03780 [Xylella fastidiosa subsp. sandyi Ann-1]UIX81796.1 hypothetical protein LZ756_02690 [Xylella fastidiosa subsp. sandyi]